MSENVLSIEQRVLLTLYTVVLVKFYDVRYYKTGQENYAILSSVIICISAFILMRFLLDSRLDDPNTLHSSYAITISL